MSKQRSEIEVTFRSTEEPGEETQSITICGRGDVIDVEDIAPEFSTTAEAVPTASGTPYLMDKGNATGSFELTLWQDFPTHADTITAWAERMASFEGIPKVGWLEVRAAGHVFLYPAALTGYRPAVFEYFQLTTRVSFTVLPCRHTAPQGEQGSV